MPVTFSRSRQIRKVTKLGQLDTLSRFSSNYIVRALAAMQRSVSRNVISIEVELHLDSKEQSDTKEVEARETWCQCVTMAI